MTELQPTEVEFTGTRKKRGKSRSKRKIAAIASIIVIGTALAVLTAILAYQASVAPQILEPTPLNAEMTD